VNYGRVLRTARRRARLTQRQVAERAGLPQPAVARAENGRNVPRADTLERILRACDAELRVAPALGAGVDRTAIRQLLELTPGERARLAVIEARNLDRALARARTRR